MEDATRRRPEGLLVTSSFLLLVVMPGATSSGALATSSFLRQSPMKYDWRPGPSKMCEPGMLESQKLVEVA